MDLLCHVRGDDDLIPAWLEHHQRLGVTAFHVIVHGPPAENATLRGLAGRYPIVVEDAYDGEFLSGEKQRRLNVVLARLRGRWFVTTRVNGGGHRPPSREATVLSRVRGVTHHFKWRRSAFRRLEERVASQHEWRHESAAYLAYLHAHAGRLPAAGTFLYSRAELFRRRLLQRAGAWVASLVARGAA